MDANNPTNSDIMHLLGKIEQKQDYNIALSEKTNGRVTALEAWKNRTEAVSEYVKEEGQSINIEKMNMNKPVFNTDAGQKLLASVATLIAVLGAYVTLKGGL